MRRGRGLIAALPLLLSPEALHAEPVPKTPSCMVERGEARAVAKVIDGETVRLDDGRTLRLAGALAPRAGDVGAEAGAWPAEAETRAALSSLVQGRTVTLWHDATRLDRYGRVLAQVTFGDEPGTTWLQGVLVAQGLARAYGRPGADACAMALAALERRAREAGRGLWSNAAYGARRADEGDAIARASGSFQVIEGTVRRTSRGGRGEVYVSMASRPRGSEGYPFAVVVPARVNELIGGVEPRALVGRRVMVRGWIEQRRGPVIVIDSKGQLEVLDETRR